MVKQKKIIALISIISVFGIGLYLVLKYLLGLNIDFDFKNIFNWKKGTGNNQEPLKEGESGQTIIYGHISEEEEV